MASKAAATSISSASSKSAAANLPAPSAAAVHDETLQWMVDQITDELQLTSVAAAAAESSNNPNNSNNSINATITDEHLRLLSDFIVGDEDLASLFCFFRTCVVAVVGGGGGATASPSSLLNGSSKGNEDGSPRDPMEPTVAADESEDGNAAADGSGTSTSTAAAVVVEEDDNNHHIQNDTRDDDELDGEDNAGDDDGERRRRKDTRVKTKRVTELCICARGSGLSNRVLDESSNVSADVVYFVRTDPNTPVSPENVELAITWGVSRSGAALDSFLRSMQHVYTPSLLRCSWPDSREEEVQTAVHRFMSTLTESVNRVKGNTVLYVPTLYHVAAADAELEHQDRSLVQRYESAAIHWTRQIKEVVLEKDVDMAAGCGPLDEIAYWRDRAKDLNSIRKQLIRPEVTHIVDVLRDAKSFYFLDPFLDLRSDIDKGTAEAFNNLRYLNTLVEPCTRLSNAEPKDIPAMVPQLLTNAQLILMYSSHYRKERFARLLRLISNEIIRLCSRRIDISAVLSGDVAASIVALHESMRAGEVWIRECRAMLEATRTRFKMEKGERLELDESFLNEIDGFVRHRCQNFLEICKAQQQFGFRLPLANGQAISRRNGSVSNAGSTVARQSDFGAGMGFSRKDERTMIHAPLFVPEIDQVGATSSTGASSGAATSSSGTTSNGASGGAATSGAGKRGSVAWSMNAAAINGSNYEGRLPRFGGARGPEIESQIIELQRVFRSKMDTLRRLDYDILDVRSTRWIDDFRALKADMDSLGAMMRQVIAAAFDSVNTMETGVEYIEAFFLIAKNEDLLLQLDRSKNRVFDLFMQMMQTVQADLQHYFNAKPPIFYRYPPYSGEAMWTLCRSVRIAQDNQMLRLCYYYPPDAAGTVEAHQFFSKLHRTLEESVWRMYRTWKESLPTTPAEFLERVLITRNSPGHIGTRLATAQQQQQGTLAITNNANNATSSPSGTAAESVKRNGAASHRNATPTTGAAAVSAFSGIAAVGGIVMSTTTGVEQNSGSGGAGIVTDPALHMLEVNFPKELYLLFEEARYWTKLGETVPPHILEICAMEERLRIARENVAIAVSAFNRIIVTLSSPAEFSLFAMRVEALESKYMAGMTKLWWSSQGIVEYFVAECRQQASALQNTIDSHQSGMAAIAHYCKAIQDTMAVVFERKKIYSVNTFVARQEEHHTQIAQKLAIIHERIVECLTTAFAPLRNDYAEKQHIRVEWHRLVETIENMVERSLRTMVQRSLAEIEKALPGTNSGEDGESAGAPSSASAAAAAAFAGGAAGLQSMLMGRADEQVFHVNVVIATNVAGGEGKPTLGTQPSTADLAHHVNSVGKNIIALAKAIPRLETSLGERIGKESAEELAALKLLPFRYNSLDAAGEVDVPPTAIVGGGVIGGANEPRFSVTMDGQALADTSRGREGATLSTMRGSYYDYLAGEEDIIVVLQRIREAFQYAEGKVKATLQQTWQVHHGDEADNLWATQKQDRRIKQGWRLEDYRVNMDRVLQRKESIDRQDVFSNVLFLQLDFTRMKETFREQCVMVIQRYRGLLHAEAKDELDGIYAQFARTINALTREPTTLDALGDQIKRCAIAEQELPRVESRFAPISDMFALLTDSSYSAGDDVLESELQLCEELPSAFEEYRGGLTEAKKLLEKYKEQFKNDLEIDLRAFGSNCTDVLSDVREKGPFSYTLTTKDAFAALRDFSTRTSSMRATLTTLNQGIEIFRFDQPSTDTLETTEREIVALEKLWTLIERWRDETNTWKKQHFLTLNSEVMLDTIEDVRKTLMRMRKEVEQRDAWIKLREDVDLLKRIVPVIDDLLTKAIRPRHWEQLKIQLDLNFNVEDKSFCLGNLLAAHVEQHAEFISNLATAAREEMKIETDLETISEFWSTANLSIEPYHSYHKIASIEEINNALAEHMTLLSGMKMSRFVDTFRSRVVQWEKSLSIATDTLDALLTVQTKWMYLENIFLESEDIKRKLVSESRRFDGVHTLWLGIVTRLLGDPNVIRGTRQDGLLDRLNGMDSDLEQIQKSLEGFLEDRRRAFPRFYFLSNDDLLEILGHTKEPEKVQPHLRKCFEGLYNLGLKKIRQRTIADSMVSADGERVAFSPAVQIEGLPVEVWLRHVEEKMRETMQVRVNETLNDLRQNVYSARKPINREQLKGWVERNEGQCLITSACINWTEEAERAIAEYGEMNGLGRRKESPLYKLYKKWKSLIKKYCYLVRQPQDKFQRDKLVALITIEVHSRDILRQLQVLRIHRVDDFEWSRQLRFYAEFPESEEGEEEGGNNNSDDPQLQSKRFCVARQTSAEVQYDYEYLGNSGRLVVTGLTDRAYMTLTTALQLHRGGLPQGPAGTGKTETVKDLGKAIAKYVMVFNCSDGLDFRSIARMLSGIVQTGAWSCFDEFNRIEVEVLSVVAQQIFSILAAVAEKRKTFLFEGSEIPLNTNCGIFVTMNPGYAGRSELPDNLKALLRPISMMVPDFTLICEITLLSQGFEESEVLSKKVSILYELMEKQLSKQDHYDFSLRNIKAVLVQAGNLKRENFPGTESQLCLKAMIDMNLPKFVKEDVPLFLSMLGDLFPGVTPGEGGLETLREACEKELTAEGLELTPQVLTKSLHLWDTLRTRHGVMVVGKTGSGKTVTWRTLSGALKRLKEAGAVPASGQYEAVRVSLLNPKSVTMDELYGSYNQATREWKDGILSDLMRQVCRDVTDPTYKWLLFDGPVDTLWIESLNTVLDDNKMLTLNSGERINMNPTVSVLFEVQDLSQASPATVSRCGMVFFNVEDLGWQPYFSRWLQSRREMEMVINAPKPDVTVQQLRLFMNEMMPKALEFRRTECTELFTTTDISAVRAFTQLFDAIANPDAAPFTPNASPYIATPSVDKYASQLRLVSTFCLIWAVGGSLTVESRQKLDVLIREFDSSFPSTETVFEYFPDFAGLRWQPWDDHPDLQRPFVPPPGTPYYRQIVPTVDTVRYQHIISQLVRNRAQLVLVGTTGTGKSLIARQVTQSFPVETHVTALLNFSAQTTSHNVQDIIEGRMEHTSKKVCGPPGGRRMICLVEDLNMPAKEKFGAQPPLELLRQWYDNGFWYDRATRSRRQVNDMQLLCCMTYGRPDITQRLLSKLVVLNITFPSENIISKIFTSILANRFNPYEELQQYTDLLIKATIQVYKRVTEDLLPIPSKSHYVYNLRDLSKVFQGIYQCHLESLECKEHVVALWVHECYRVFADRMNDATDKAWFRNLIVDKLATTFQTKWSSMMRARSTKDTRPTPQSQQQQQQQSQQQQHNQGASGAAGGAQAATTQVASEKEEPIFVDFWDGENDEQAKYRLVPAIEALRTKVEAALENYNNEPGTQPMNLVCFTDALEHLCRINRIIRQPRGNALLVGLGGSGRNSLTRLATYLAGYSLFTIEIHKKYDTERFHEDLRTLYRACGVKRQQKVFYFSDNQIMHASFLEDINNMLSAGEVPNLFPKDDVAIIREEVYKPAMADGCRNTPEDIYNYFIDCARQNLHIVVAMSPAHKLFRVRLRQFPSLVSCTSIDWFVDWPNEALKEVGLRYLQDTRDAAAVENGIDPAVAAAASNEDPDSVESDAMLDTIADMFVIMHDATSHESHRLEEQLHRYNYVTPSSYLDLVRGYRQMYARKHAEIIEQRDKLVNGMSKLEDTKRDVNVMKEELKVQDEKLQVKSVEVERATEAIQVRQRTAEEQQTLLGSEKAKIEQTKKAALADQMEAQVDLDRAMPTLLEAQAALDKLDKNDINEIKSYKTPAAMIRTVMDAVQTALHRKLDWDDAKKSLTDSKFIDTLKHYHEENDMTDQKLLNSLEKYVKRPDFTPTAASAVSKAAGGLCQWVIAIHKYGNIFKEVHPKIVKNENAQQKVRAQEEMLRQKEERLNVVMSELQQLQNALQANIDEKNRLLAEARETQEKLNRAQIIVDGLEGERGRWTESIAHYNAAIGNLVGDTMLTCGFLCYCGVFPAEFRQGLLNTWTREIRRLHLPLTKNMDVVNFLVDPTEVRDWQQAGLPGDDFSRENGGIVTRGTRWPLMIDPQQQALRWIKNMERDNGLKVIDQKQPDFQKTVEYAVQFGCPLLLQDVLEEIDPLLEPVVSKAFVRRGNRLTIKIGDNHVDYNENFKLYITTRLTNPHYTPETCTKVCLLNFSVKEQGLEEQLLKIVVEMEKPELEEENELLILETAAAKKETKLLEDEILNLLFMSEVSLLENVRLIETLQSARTTAAKIQLQLKVAEETSQKIQSAREQYRVCAQRASTLFFVLADLGAIDTMYQFALEPYIALFRTSIKRSAEKIQARTLEEHVATLIDWHTNAVYSTTCRGLFERDKLLFAFHMTMRILQGRGEVNIEEYVFFMKGGQLMDKQTRLPNPAPLWLSERAWDHILELDRLTNFHGIATSLEQSAGTWHQWFLQERPEEADLPDEWQARTASSYLQRMILARCLRPDRIVFMVYQFIEDNLGPQYVEPPAFNLKDTFDESRNTIPLIFILSPGVDPTSQLNVLAQREGKKLRSLALGQGQGDNAKRAVQECSQSGGWVFLANCHLMVSWMVDLEKVVEDLAEQRPHEDFRLWLSSVPTPAFPIGILQRSIKLTSEPPTGIKSNMLRLYGGFTDEQFSDNSSMHANPRLYQSLLFALCYFHSVLLERRKYGTLGYNVVYDFTYSDFEVSENILQLYIGSMPTDSVADIPFRTIRYLIAEASYGGRVTDDWDRRVLNTYMEQFMCPRAVTDTPYHLSSAEEYYIPTEGTTLQSFRDECMKLPLTDPPEAFGQHTNADIASRIAESTNLLNNLIDVNATLARGGASSSSGGGGAAGGSAAPMSIEERCLEIIASIEEPSKGAIPNLIDYDAVVESTKEDRGNALNTCLLQEIQRYNALLAKVHRQKAELRRAVKGEIVMSEELETIFNALLMGRVPLPWMSAYPSTKPLASWSADLVDRVEQMKLWGQRTPTVFWLAGFTYPTGFLKSLQQQQARSDQISIDQYGWEFNVLPAEERTIVSRNHKGAFIRGVYLEGAGWSSETGGGNNNNNNKGGAPSSSSSAATNAVSPTSGIAPSLNGATGGGAGGAVPAFSGTLCEPKPMELIVNMPIIHFIPKVRDGKPKPAYMYECPLYMYPIRTGTRERPSFVVAVDLPTKEAPPQHYTKRGTALLLSTSD